MLQSFDSYFFLKLINSLLEDNVDKIFILLNHISHKEINFKNFLHGLIHHFKCIFLSKKNKITSFIKYDKKIIQLYIDQSKKLSYLMLNQAIETCIHIIHKNDNSKLMIDICIIQLSYIFSIQHNKDINDLNLNDKTYLVQIIWKKFINKIREKMNPIYLNIFERRIDFQIFNEKTFLVLSSKLEKDVVILIHHEFRKFVQYELKSSFLKFGIIRKSIMDKYHFLYQENKFLENLIKKLNLRIFCSFSS
ncbi:hypothetical protein [Blattabacterium cuenoti]|uniref:hypothetical protein n=1 Tax=Blattabacterium cuenoti TaxID=1653831 RepID=UPI00163D33CC|nr:hypothetical protein [Blattabacterium cuenoti]